jgi:pyridoxine 5-phosphate synthase
MPVELHVNVDHVATLRQARGTRYPDPVHAAIQCELAGAHGITVHLREDRRHIQDRDVRVLREVVTTRLNLEMAATEEMLRIAIETAPDLVTLVPEKREERTTEGGLDVVAHQKALKPFIASLLEANIPTSLFVDPDARQIDAAVALGAATVELHTGDYANAQGGALEKELQRLADAAEHAEGHPLIVAAGHGLTVRNLPDLLVEAPPIGELNIGHALVSDAMFYGLEGAVERFLEAIADGEAE